MRSPDLSFESRKLWRLATAPFRPLPSFIIAGAPKCGTSTLYDSLVKLPGVRRGARKEPTNFIHYPGSRFRASMNYPIQFPGQKFIVGDGSVEYFTHPDAPKNIREIAPNVRLIFLLRNPVHRAWSDYQMFRKFGSDIGDFSATVQSAMRWLNDPSVLPLVDAAACQAHHPARYVLCGWYVRALERWLRVFSREQCLVVISEEFFENPRSIFPSIYQHIGLDISKILQLPKSRMGFYAETMPADIEGELKAFFKPRNQALAELLGRELPWE